jgi:hypothetical protein
MFAPEQLLTVVVWTTQSIAGHINSNVSEAVLRATERLINVSPIRFNLLEAKRLRMSTNALPNA